MCDAAKGENACNCPLDCGPCCPDGVCREDRNETAANCPSDCALNIRLLVIDEQTGAHLPGATVRCTFEYAARTATYGPTITNSDGRTSFSGVGGGNYICTGELTPAYHPGYVKFTVYPLSTPQEYVIPLRQNPACLQGTVYDAVTLEPLDNATVYCTNSDNTFRTRTVIASVMGYFYFEPVPPGSYRCYASRPAYFPNSNSGYVEAGKMATIDIYLNPLPGGIIGTVYNLANNTVVPGATITCTADTAQSLPQKVTDGKGFYYIPNVAAARVVCTATVPDFSPDTRTGVVVNGYNTTINFYLNELPGSLQVTVVENNTNIPIPGATVSCSASTLTLTTPSNGSVLYTPVSPGNGYCCYASAAGYSSNSLCGISVTRNKLTAVVIPLSPLPGQLIVITVDNSTKELLPGASVTVTPGTSYSGLTVAPTASIQFTVPAGTYSATATASGYYPGSNNSFSITKGQTLTVYVYLNPLPGQLIVTVYASDTNGPLNGASVSIRGPGQQAFVTGATAPPPNATLQYTIVNYGFYTATASASGYTSDTKTSATAVVANTTVTILLILNPLPNQLTVFVRDAQTFALINGASVTLNPTGSQRTAVSGSTVYTNLAAGTYTATATATGYNTNTSAPAVQLARNESKETTVYLTQLSCQLIVTVVNAATNAVISGATVSLNNAFYTVQTTNPTATFTVFASNAATSATASATGYRGTGSANFSCTPGTTQNVTIPLTPIVFVTLIVENSYPAAVNKAVPSANVTLNGTRTLTATSATTSTYVYEVSGFPYVGVFDVVAPGFVSFLNRQLTFTDTVRNRTISITPVNYDINFIIYETLTNGTNVVIGSNDTASNNILDFASDLQFPLSQGYYKPVGYLFQGAVSRYSNTSGLSSQNFVDTTYSSAYPLSVQAGFQTLLNSFLQGSTGVWASTSAPQNLRVRTAPFQSIAPTIYGPFYAVATNLTGFVVNFGNLVTGSSFVVTVPDFPATPIRQLIVPLPYRRAFGFINIQFVPYEKDGATVSTFTKDEYAAVIFNTSTTSDRREVAETGKLTGSKFALLETGLEFGSIVRSLEVNIQSEFFDVAKSGYFNPATSSLALGLNPIVPGLTQFVFPPQTLLSALFTTNPTTGQSLRNPNARLFYLLQYRMIRK